MKGVQSSLHMDPGHPQCFVSKWHNSSYSEGVSGSHQLLQMMAHQGFPSRLCVESCVQDGPVKKIPLCFQFVSKCSPLPSCHTVCPRSGKSGVCFSLSKILGFINTIFLPCTGDPLYHDHLGFPRLFSTLLPSWNSGHSLFSPDFFPSLAPDGIWLRSPPSHPKEESGIGSCASLDCGCGPV